MSRYERERRHHTNYTNHSNPTSKNFVEKNQLVELARRERQVEPPWQFQDPIDYDWPRPSTSSAPESAYTHLHQPNAILSSEPRPISIVSPFVACLRNKEQQQQQQPPPPPPPLPQTLSSISNLASRSRRPIVISSSPSESESLPRSRTIKSILKNHPRYPTFRMSSETKSPGDKTNSQQQQQQAPPAIPTRVTITTTSRTNPIAAMAFSPPKPAPPAPAVIGENGGSGDNSLSAAYERRRSIYESIPSNYTAAPESMPVNVQFEDLNNRTTPTTPASGPSLVSVQEPSTESVSVQRQQRPSDLSLDEILLNLESGRLALAASRARAASLSHEPINELSPNPDAAQIEMHEFSSPVAVNQQGQQRSPSDNAKSAPVSSSGVLTRRKVSMSTSQSGISTGTELSTSVNSSRDAAAVQLGDVDKRDATGGCGDSESGGASLKRRLSKEASARRHEIATGFEIAWLDFTYSVEPNIFEDPRWGRINKIFHKEGRMILKGLSGGFKSGQMVALMGPSGAGKTCLLESVSGVRTSGIGGRMCLRGRKRAQLVIVPQHDDFLPQFSVEETIIYGSRMKNPAGTNHRKVANTVIEQLGLQVCRHNNIQRCSGGQRKRVAIAQELVSRPNILILDEPTSGLDSSCCYQTMKVLRDVLDKSVLTDEPMAIVSTIHQPSAKVFKMFDLVYLLGKTGYMAYSGPPDELLPTIGDVTGLECPTYSNPSDFMIELVAYDYGEEPVEQLIKFERQKAAQYKRDFEKRAGQRRATGGNQKDDNSSLSSCAGAATRQYSLTPSKSDTHLAKKGQSRLDQIQHRLKATDLLNGVSHVIYKNNVTVPLRKATDNDQRSHPFLWHTWVHLNRSYLQAIRDPILNNMRILIHLGFAMLLVMLYGQKSGEARGCPPVLGLPQEITDSNNESMTDLADNVGFLFMCIMLITYVSLMSTVLTFPIDIKTVGKEYKNGWYGTLSYFLGKTIADLPFIVIYPVIYCLITWYMTNQAQDHAWRYFYFTGLIIMNAMNSQSFGLILGALFVNSVTAATFLGPVMTIPWYLFTGFTKRAHRLSEPFKSASKFLFTRYIFEGILDTVYGNDRCNCSAFLQEYYELRDEEASRLGQLVSVETLSSLDYYDDLETIARDSLYNETLFPVPDNNNNNNNNNAQATGLAGILGGGTGPSVISKWLERTVDAASTVFADGDSLNLATLMETNEKASSMFSFGLDFEPTCPSDYNTYVVQDFRLGERNVEKVFVIVFGMLCAIRVITFVLVSWKIRTRQL